MDQSWPTTVEAAVDILLDQLLPKDIEHIRSLPKKNLILMHHGLGRCIRNNFGLWQDNEELLNTACDDAHPDSASMTIIIALWKRLRGNAEAQDL